MKTRIKKSIYKLNRHGLLGHLWRTTEVAKNVTEYPDKSKMFSGRAFTRYQTVLYSGFQENVV